MSSEPEPAALYCANCGSPFAAGSRFCSRCGAALTTPAAEDPKTGPPPVAATAAAPPGIDLSLPHDPVPPQTAQRPPASNDADDNPEGGVGGWWHRRQQAGQERQQQDARYREAAGRIAGGDDSPAALELVRSLADTRHEKDAERTLRAYTDHVLQDEILSQVEEDHWNQVADALQVGQSFRRRDPEVFTRLTIAKINDGRLPSLAPGQSHLLEKRGEVVHLEAPADLLKEVIDREFRGGSRGVSIPIAKGIRYRTGSFRGKTVVVGSHLETADSGTLTVTSNRIVYTGTRKTLEVPYTKLAAIDGFTDGIRIHASNRQNAPLFKMAPSNASIIAATISAAAQRSGSP